MVLFHLSLSATEQDFLLLIIVINKFDYLVGFSVFLS